MRQPIDAFTGGNLAGGFGSNEGDMVPVSIYICNISSVCFYVLQGGYAIYMLYKLIFVNTRSLALISATLMLLYSSISLGILFSLSSLDYDEDKWSTADKWYYVLCSELPFTLVFIAHWIILYEYLELAVVLPILNKLGELAADASNKISSVRQCLRAAMIIVIACLVAHFVDKAFYTFKESSTQAEHSVTYFAFLFKVCLMGMLAYIFIRLPQIIKREPLLKFKRTVWLIHVLAIIAYFATWAFYVVAFSLWSNDPNQTTDTGDSKLRFLAVAELLYNLSSVFLGVLLFRNMDLMTRKVQDEYYDPVFRRDVPFFVYFANCKLTVEHVEKESDLMISQAEPKTDSKNKKSLNQTAVMNNSSQILTSSLVRSGRPEMQSLASSQHSRFTRRTGANTLLERELIRLEQTYSQICDDKKWNHKTINLSLQFLSLDEKALAAKVGDFTLPYLAQVTRSESQHFSTRTLHRQSDSAELEATLLESQEQRASSSAKMELMLREELRREKGPNQLLFSNPCTPLSPLEYVSESIPADNEIAFMENVTAQQITTSDSASMF